MTRFDDTMPIKPGCRFKVVDRWPDEGSQNSDGMMDRWLGATLTVSGIKQGWTYGRCMDALEAEECPKWFWFPDLVAWVDSDTDEDELTTSDAHLEDLFS